MTPKELKNSILQLAIQGRLVEQRPEEGTAQELYEQIQAEKQRLIQEGKIKKEKPLPEITEDEKPFEIPESWMWVRLGNIVKSISAGGDKPKIFSKEKTEKCPIEVLSNGEKNCGIFGYTNIPTITERSLKGRRQDRRSAQSHLPAVRAVPSVSQVVGIGVKSRKKK